ncbi:unnamed protein product [Clonostachys solani]|uniref:Uncharacterized protein n=1 Tax=Clonostachys solani TaxID=160281 RepID=A0A9N9YYV2_9HYPO|nr:unnamed protein product [Clonostachys solani]
MAANVNRPVVKEQKDADVNRKLQIYGIISAFKHGKVPSNDQIDVALNSFLESQALSRPSDKLSPDGKLLVEDLKEIVQQSKSLILSKNQGDLIQDFIWQTTQYEYKSITAPGAPVDKDTAKRDGDEALKGLRTLGTLIITNGQFRKLLKDFSILIRDIAGDAAGNAANKVRPSEEQLGQLDQAAPDNTWHEKPNLSKENLKKQAQNVYGGNAKKDTKDVAQAGIQASNAQQSSNAAEVDRQAAQSAARQVAEDKVDQAVDDETKQKIKERNAEYRRRARTYFDKKMPKERKDQIIFRLKKMILECQQHTDYMEAIQTLLRLAENYGRHGRTFGSGSASTAKETRSGFAAAEADLRTIIERFANGTSTEDLWASIAQIYKDAEHDEELRNWFKTVDAYVRRCLLEQGYILEDESTVEWDRLYDKGRYLLREKYRSHTDRVLDEIKFVANQFDEDVQNKAFAKSVEKLFHDLGNDEFGKAVFKPHLLKDLTEVIIPAILEKIAYVPIPRIEYSDPKIDAVIENLVLESDNFMPNVLEIASENFVRLGRKKFSNKHKHNIEVKASGIQMDLRDVGFHIKRKQGFPSITDTGVADIILPGNGFSFKLKISSAEKKDKQHFFKIDKVDVDFKDLKLKVIKSNHKLLLTLFKPLALRAIRPVLQKVVETAIREQFNRLDSLFHDVKLEVDNMVTEAKGDPENAPNIYKRYSTAFQKRLAQHKEKAKKKVTENRKFNMAITKEDSIFPNVNLPGGISSKATEYRELARKGDKWESPVFSIGTAKHSTSLPSAPKIERKAHPATNGRTNGHTNGATNGHTNGASNIPRSANLNAGSANFNAGASYKPTTADFLPPQAAPTQSAPTQAAPALQNY